MQSYAKAALASLILLGANTAYASTIVEEVGHLILFGASRIDKNCFDRNIGKYKDEARDVRVSRFLENPKTGDYRLWHIVIYPKDVGSQDDQKIRELVNVCEIEEDAGKKQNNKSKSKK